MYNGVQCLKLIPCIKSLLFRKKRRKEKRSHSSEDSDNEDQKRKKKKKVKKDEEAGVEMEPVKSRKSQKNGFGNGKVQEITLVDLEEELNLEELMKQKVR